LKKETFRSNASSTWIPKLTMMVPRKTKELMGLVASLVLRCDDCVTYHIIQCVEQKVSDAEFFEAFNIGLIVGGSIAIPHLRSAVEMLEECRRKERQT